MEAGLMTMTMSWRVRAGRTWMRTRGPADAAVDGYTKDLESMQQTLQKDSLKPAGVVGDAPHLLSELGDG